MEDILTDLVYTSSSSSSDSSDEEFFEFHRKFYSGKKGKHRVKNFITDVVHKYSEAEFRQNFRVSRTTADKLIEKFRSSAYYKLKNAVVERKFQRNIKYYLSCGLPVTRRLIVEWQTSLICRFNMSISSVYRHIGHIVEFFFEISPNYIKFPTTDEEKREKAQAFSQIAGIDNVIACIDGCYIYIRKPAKKIASTYVNRHGLLSISMQAICDADKTFIDVCVGSPSKIHDARIFKLSYISKDLPTICGDQYYVLGDAAYPLRSFLLTPFKDYGTLTAKQKFYNKKHCQTRVKIENAFGLLKQRFRQLMRLDIFDVDKMCKFVMSCCVLHNICIAEADLWDLDECNDALNEIPSNAENMENAEEISVAVLKHLGELKRNAVVNSL